MWGGMYSDQRDSFLPIVREIANGISVKDLMEKINESGHRGHRSLPMNLVLADNSGDIAYMLLLAFPDRKDKTPYIGSRVLDGTRSDFDWNGLVSVSKLPQSLNPKKGYIVTANNR